MKQHRIWELDALRGIAILGVIVIHLLFDLRAFAGISIGTGPVLSAVQQYGGVIFVILSGICVTLGSRSVKRGLVVLGCGLVITLVTVGMVHLGMAHRSIAIYFGVLHLLGTAMLLWPLFRKLPLWALAAVAVILIALGYWFSTVTVENPWLFPLGLTAPGFASGDYFPLLPQLGWFLLGAFLGKTLYRRKSTLFPRVSAQAAPLRALCWCGRHSLWIYLLHQPLLYGLTMLF